MILRDKIAAGDRGSDFSDVAHLAGQVAGHEVHVVGEIFPGAADTGHLRLAAELAFGTDFAGHAGYFAGEAVQLVHHCVDGVFEFENFAFHVHRDLARQVSAGDGGGHFGDVAHLRCEVSGHGVYRVGKIFPGTGNARHDSLSAQLAVRADFARDAGHFRSKRTQLIHHRVDGFFELKNFAADVDRNLAGKIAAGDGGCDFSNVAHLPGQVAGHRIDRVGEVLPGSGHARNLRLAAQLAVGANFASHARDFSGKHAELLNHGVDDVGGTQKLAFQRPPVHVQPDGLSQVALRHTGDGAGDFRGGPEQIFDQSVDRTFHLAPRAFRFMKPCALPGLSFLADHLTDSLQFVRHLLVHGDDLVKCVGDLSRESGPGTGQPHGKVSGAHGLQAREDYGKVGRIGLGNQSGMSVVVFRCGFRSGTGGCGGTVDPFHGCS